MIGLQSPPKYQHKPIQQLVSLSRTLDVPLVVLQQVAATADGKYRPAKPIVKADGSIRQPWDALEPLKNIQKRIKQRILEKVNFPDYLTGSLKGKDPRKNAALHERAVITVCEDVDGFFPNTASSLIYTVWTEFFGFSHGVASLLTDLTTKDGCLPQGAATSSHLANLVFWRREHSLYECFKSEGISYSRFVDDITVSSVTSLPGSELTRCISRIYGMMQSCGYKAKRKKQEIQRNNRRMTVTKLVVNQRAAIPARERQAIRAAVHHLEVRVKSGDLEGIVAALNSATGRVGRLGQMHPTEATRLKLRLSAIRKHLQGMP